MDWLRLQRRFAFVPERVRDRLVETPCPRALLTDPRTHGQSLGGVKAARDDVRRLESFGARVLPLGHLDYPDRLAALPDAPPVLHVLGDPRVLASRAVAIVGARAATKAACAQARSLARGLAERGVSIVSGLARGVDAEAHRGALEAGGVSVAVLPCGVDRVYPPEHRGLAGELGSRGAVVSEMPLGTPPRRAFFPLRNRIISGLCSGVIVVEARSRSGSLITVRHALEQGRDVFVLPGSLEGPFASGSNRLLREGARAILSADDVFEDLGWPSQVGLFEPDARSARGRAAVPTSAPSENPLAFAVLAVLEREPLSPDALVERLGEAPGRLAECLVDLELAGQIVLERDGRLHRRG